MREAEQNGSQLSPLPTETLRHPQHGLILNLIPIRSRPSDFYQVLSSVRASKATLHELIRVQFVFHIFPSEVFCFFYLCMLYGPGKDFTVYSYTLHNRKRRLEAFFLYCRYPTKEWIRAQFDASRAVIHHDLSNDSYYFRREKKNQLGRFVSQGDFLLQDFVPEGGFENSREFEYHHPRVSAVTQGEKGWTCHITENRLRLNPEEDEKDESDNSGDTDNPNECFEYLD